MPSKKKKYNARFPAGRIKKIMQTDEEVGKVAQAVPVIISRTLELFVGSLLTKAMQITNAKNAKTLSPSHMKQCILSDQRFDFLKDLVKSVQDSANGEDELTTSPGLLPPTYPDRRRSTGSCSTTRQSSVIKEELIIDDTEETESSKPLPAANASTLHLVPNFYSETSSDQRIGVHQPLGYLPPAALGHSTPPQPCPEPPSMAHSPVLVMDEDYDT